jgi:hypothetical protein
MMPSLTAVEGLAGEKCRIFSRSWRHGRQDAFTKEGIADAVDPFCGYIVVEADTIDAAVCLFDNHPHFTVFPGESVGITVPAESRASLMPSASPCSVSAYPLLGPRTGQAVIGSEPGTLGCASSWWRSLHSIRRPARSRRRGVGYNKGTTLTRGHPLVGNFVSKLPIC